MARAFLLLAREDGAGLFTCREVGGKDYSELVGGAKRSVEMGPSDYEPGQDVSDEHSARHLVLPLLIGAVFLIGFALEKGDVLGVLRSSSATPDLLLLSELPLDTQTSSAQPETFRLPEGLTVYGEDQYLRFIRGLRGLSIVELHELERAKRADKRRAREGLVPYFQDALFLL